MPYTANACFKRFRDDAVDLERSRVERARASRDFLAAQIKLLEDPTRGIPKLDGAYVSFGSFARRTKIRPLDDIDMLQPLDPAGTSNATWEDAGGYQARLKVPADSPLRQFADVDGYVNSTRVLNRIRASLQSVSQYKSAEIKKTGEAVVVNLTSYEWVFDLVPGIRITLGGQAAGYIIPNGKGEWKRTNPKIDQDRVTEQNQRHGGMLVPVVRVLKFWNRRTHKPVLPSYYFEVLVLKAFESAPPITDIPAACQHFFRHVKTPLWLSCPDPKGLGPALDADITGDTKLKVDAALDLAAGLADSAMMMSRLGREEEAIKEWRKVFGQEFPTYG